MKKSRETESMLVEINDRWFDIRVDPLFDENHHFLGAVHIMRDITQQKKIEQELNKGILYDPAVVDACQLVVEQEEADPILGRLSF